MIKKIALTIFFLLILAYALFQGRYVILGPRVVVNFPKEEALVDVGPLLISGTATNITHLSLNDRQIYTDKEGRFEEKLIAEVGINIIKLRALDRFGREKETLLRVIAK